MYVGSDESVKNKRMQRRLTRRMVEMAKNSKYLQSSQSLPGKQGKQKRFSNELEDSVNVSELMRQKPEMFVSKKFNKLQQ